MTKKTQCPACLSIYKLSDEQYQASSASGKVRCGRCRQLFDVTFLSNTSKTTNHDAGKTIGSESELQDTSEYTIDTDLESTNNNARPSKIDTTTEHDKKIIDEIDHLITEKILHNSITQETTTYNHSEDDILQLDPSCTDHLFVRLLSMLAMLIIILALTCTLIYQLWLRQQVNWLEASYINPALNYVSEKLNVTIPVRQDLAKINLVSAVIEPHPTRSSTILIKVGLVNRSNISQPLPWLQLSLTDKDGRLIARRALNPEDYLYNNNTENLIPSNVKKSISIEVLAFPNHAHGYELHLLRKQETTQ